MADMSVASIVFCTDLIVNQDLHQQAIMSDMGIQVQSSESSKHAQE